MINKDNQEFNNPKVNPEDITFPITLNTVIEENLNTVFYLEKYSNFKQDLSTLNKTNFDGNGILVLNKNEIRIENSFFTQNIPLDMIQSIEENNSMDYYWSMLLENKEKILLKFTESSPSLNKNFIIFKKTLEDYRNTSKELFNLMGTIHQRKSLIKSLPAQTTIKTNIDSVSGLTIKSAGYLVLYNDFVILSTNYYQQNFPYYLITEAKLNNGVLEIIFDTPGTIYVDYSWHQEEIAKDIVKTIYEKKNAPNLTAGDVNAYNVNNQEKNSQINPPQYNHNFQQSPQQNQNFRQSPQQNQYVQSNQYNIPTNQKSVAIGVILNMLVVGLGYAYVGKWGEGLLLLIIYTLLIFFGFISIIIGIGFIFLLIALILWIFSLIRTIEMIEKYNKGQLY